MNKDLKILLLSVGAVVSTGLVIGASMAAFNQQDWKKATGFGLLATCGVYLSMKLGK